MLFAQPTAAALNHLLAQNSWAMPRLARYAGKTVRFQVAPFIFAYTILADGSVLSTESDTSADAICVIPPALLPRLLAQDPLAYTNIRSEGDGALLSEIFSLSRQLRWDAAEDLSHLTGDILAERIVQSVKQRQDNLQHTARNLAEAAAEYWTEEQPLIVKPAQLTQFVQQVDTLRDDVARLAQRINRL